MGLRERKKVRTRESLVSAALSLFTTQGFDATTVDQIAAAADVSQRTFFRYFLTKEDVALEPVRQVESRFLEVLRRQPLGAPPMQALRESSRQTWRRLEEEQQMERHLGAVLLVARTPALAMADAGRSEAHMRALAEEVQRRLGTTDDAEIQAELVVEMFAAANRIAQRRWLRGASRDLNDLQGELDGAMEVLATLPLDLD